MKVGDTVKLKSGGPEMTVLAKNSGVEDNLVKVGWFCGDQSRLHEQWIPRPALTPYPSKK